MIRAERIGRRVGATWALADLTFDVARGERLWVTGPPRSGRSLLLRLLATHVPLSAGTLLLNGLDATVRLSAARRHVACADGNVEAGTGLTVSEYLQLTVDARRSVSDAGDVRRIREALVLAGVPWHAAIDRLTGSQQTALSFAGSLITLPAVLIVDDRNDCGGEDARGAFRSCVSAAVANGAAAVVVTDDATVRRGLGGRELRLEAGRSAVVSGQAPATPALMELA